MIVGETAAEQEAWHRVIADVIDQLKNPKEKGEESNNAPGSIAAIARDISAPVTIGSDAHLNQDKDSDANARGGNATGTSLPSSHVLSSDSPPVLAPVSNAGTVEPKRDSDEIPRMPAPASGSFKGVNSSNRSPAGSQGDEVASSQNNTVSTGPSTANAVGGAAPSSPSQSTSTAIPISNTTSSPSHSNASNNVILSSSPARKTLDQRIPAIAALDEPSSGSSSPAPGQVPSDAQSPAHLAMRHPSVSHLQATASGHAQLTRRPSLSNLLVPVPKANGCLDIPNLNAADIEGQLALLVDDLKFICNALSWREAPVLDLVAFEASLAPSQPAVAAIDTQSQSQPSQTQVDHPTAVVAAEVGDSLDITPPVNVSTPQPDTTISDSSHANTEEKQDDEIKVLQQEPVLTNQNEPLTPEPSAIADHSVTTATNTSSDVHVSGFSDALSEHRQPSAFSLLHNDSSPMLYSSQDKLGASQGSADDAQVSGNSSAQLEVVPTVVVTNKEGESNLPSIPSVDPKTHPRLSTRWPASPRSSLTQQLFLALDSSATDADREAMLDDIIGGIDDATSTTLSNRSIGSARDYNDAETTADLLAALMDPENSNYSASPSSFHTSPLELAMQQQYKNEPTSFSNIASSSDVGSAHPDFSSAPSGSSSVASSSDVHASSSSSGNAISSATNAADTELHGVEKSLIAASDSDSPRDNSDSSPRHPTLGELKSSQGISGSGSGWTRPERRPAALAFNSTASSHRTATATEISQLEKAEGESRLRRLRERLISSEDPYEIYDCSERAIGKGGMGEVFFATIKRSNSSVQAHQKKVAIKKLQTFFKGKDRLPTILNEINVMAHSKHPNIINYIASYQVDQELWVAMEYMDKGSLYDLVRLNIKLDEKHMAYIIKQIVYALTFIHDLKRVHRDIKVDNVLMSSRGEIKLADFGAAVQLTFQRLKRTTMTGTPYYMSPEVIGGKQYDELVDVWSLGILCIELAERAPPYYDLPPDQALDRIVKDGVKGLQGRRYSSDFLDFVNNKCLQFDPAKRWTASQLQTHPFLKKAVSQQDFAAHLDSLDSMSQVDSGCNIL